jgi:hypothetical protein
MSQAQSRERRRALHTQLANSARPTCAPLPASCATARWPVRRHGSSGPSPTPGPRGTGFDPAHRPAGSNAPAHHGCAQTSCRSSPGPDARRRFRTPAHDRVGLASVKVTPSGLPSAGPDGLPLTVASPDRGSAMRSAIEPPHRWLPLSLLSPPQQRHTLYAPGAEASKRPGTSRLDQLRVGPTHARRASSQPGIRVSPAAGSLARLEPGRLGTFRDVPARLRRQPAARRPPGQ